MNQHPPKHPSSIPCPLPFSLPAADSPTAPCSSVQGLAPTSAAASLAAVPELEADLIQLEPEATTGGGDSAAHQEDSFGAFAAAPAEPAMPSLL